MKVLDLIYKKATKTEVWLQPLQKQLFIFKKSKYLFYKDLE